MLKQHNNRAASGNRLARRPNQIDPKRLELLEKILEESSSIALNDRSHQSNPRQALEDHSKLLQLIEELRKLELRCNPKLPSRSDESWTKFFRWVDDELHEDDKGLKTSDCVGVSKLSKTCTGDEEYSLITKVPQKKGNKIFGVPRKIMLSTETMQKDDDLFEFIKTDPIASSMQNVVLVLHLLNEYSKGQKSHWSHYLAILPSKILPVLTLTIDKIKYLLVSAHIFEILKMIRAISRQYSYFFKRLQATNLPISRDFTYEYYCWGVSVVCSRQNEIPPLDRRASLMPVVHALIPVLDMCNHDRQSSQAIFEDSQSRLFASKDLSINDEVTINYGCRSSGDFYIHNGFVPKEVPFDTVPITIVLNKQDILLEAKAKLLKTLNMPTFGRFRLTLNDHENRHKRDPHLTMFLIVYFLNEQEIEYILSNDNPVGIADGIYEYVQYERTNNDAIDEGTASTTYGAHDGQSNFDIQAAKERLTSCVKDYLSKRGSIGIALINRTISDIEEASQDVNMSMMLEHERSIYESYLINCSAE